MKAKVAAFERIQDIVMQSPIIQRQTRTKTRANTIKDYENNSIEPLNVNGQLKKSFSTPLAERSIKSCTPTQIPLYNSSNKKNPQSASKLAHVIKPNTSKTRSRENSVEDIKRNLLVSFCFFFF